MQESYRKQNKGEEQPDKGENWKDRTSGQPRRLLYDILWQHTFEDRPIPTAELQDALLSAARTWEFQGWSPPLAEEWERNGDEIARDILRKYDPEWAEAEREKRRKRYA